MKHDMGAPPALETVRAFWDVEARGTHLILEAGYRRFSSALQALWV